MEQIKSVDVKSSTYINFDKENDKKDPKFEVGDHVRISKYKNIFPKDSTSIGLKTLLWSKKLKILCDEVT